MNRRSITIGCIAAAVVAVGIAPSAFGLSLVLGGPLEDDFREAELADAIDGFTGSGKATVDEVNTGFPGMAPWTEVAEHNEDDGASDSSIFTVSLDSGSSWGAAPASGTWTINDANFWTTYGNGAISMHVGNGNGDPDHFVWLLEVGTMTGAWSYRIPDGATGGGLSNLKLYGSGGTTVPDGGATLALLGLAFAGLVNARRFKCA